MKVTTLHQSLSSYNKKPFKKDYYNLIFKFIKSHKIKKVIDIGCATGFFSYFLSKKVYFLGIDVNAKLLKIARRLNVKNNKSFLKCNLFDCSESRFKKYIKRYDLNNYDLITLFGTLTSFDNANIIFKRMERLKSKYLILHAPLNEYTDSKINFTFKNKNKFKKGAITIFSKSTIRKIVKNKFKIKFLKYNMKKKLKKNKNYPLNNYHLDLRKGKIATNDMGVIYNEYLIFFERL